MDQTGRWGTVLQVVGALALLGVCGVLAAGLVSGAVLVMGDGLRTGPDRIVLELDLEQPLAAQGPLDPLMAALMGDELLTVRDVVDALERAGDDERVVGLVATVGGASGGLATAQEVRDAVARFRATGKPAVAFAETFGEGTSGVGGYYVATAFDEVYLQPSGDVGLVGLAYETPFLEGTLAKLDVEAQLDRRHEYKSAMNTFTEDDYTGPHREAMEALMEAQYGQVVRGLGARLADRDVAAADVDALIAEGPFLGSEALERGLVDGLAYRDEVLTAVMDEAGEDAERLSVAAYLEQAGRPHDEGERVALIYGVGSVVRGESAGDPLTGSVTMGSDTVARAFRAAVDDEVRAIVFRVDSPGGSYVASDTIWREVVRAREAGVPVVVSMGDVAGSGGYFVAMAADRIVAQPGTVTGSIGVVGGKLVTREFFSDTLGVTFDGVATSENGTFYSDLHPYSEAGWARHQALLDRIYADFTEKVAQGREMPLEAVEDVARGRIWSGEDALELGLVDELGGFAEALAAAQELAGLGDEAALRVVVFPRQPDVWTYLVGEPDENSGPIGVLGGVRAVFEDVRVVVEVLREAGVIDGRRGELSMPVVPVVE